MAKNDPVVRTDLLVGLLQLSRKRCAAATFLVIA